MIHVYDTLSREVRPLEPLEPGLVRIYVCGPTVYDDCHIGHLMGPVLFDATGRWIRARGHRLRFVNNITDIDDKIINRAAATGEAWHAIAERYAQQYFDFLRELHVVTVTEHPRCTEYVPQMVRFVERLIADDRAYVTSDGVYYDVMRQDGYGKLSGRRVEEMIAGSRVEASAELRHPADFALWKLAKPGEPTWDSPWGLGRPGWHLECSVMSSELLGPSFDIHGGGDDLKFPHHENEIAQSEAHGDSYARSWMHHGLIQFGGRKIAKSDPRMKDPEFSRQFQARWLLDTYGAATIRFFLLRGHYRRPIDFEPRHLEAAQRALVRMFDRLGDLAEQPGDATLEAVLALEVPAAAAAHRDRFVAHMDDDFGTGEAIAELFALGHLSGQTTGAEQRAVQQLTRDLGRLLGLFQPGDRAAIPIGGTGGADVETVVGVALAVRNAARARKDFAVADGIRTRLTALGVVVLDGSDGSKFELERGADGVADAVLGTLIALRDEARAAGAIATSDAIRDALAQAGITDA